MRFFATVKKSKLWTVKWIPFGICLILLALLIILFPPSSTLAISTFFALVIISLLYLLSIFHAPKKDKILVISWFVSFFLLSMLVGFDILNIILITCFIILLKLVLK